MLELKLEVVTWGSWAGGVDIFSLPSLFSASASALEEAVDGAAGAADTIGSGPE